MRLSVRNGNRNQINPSVFLRIKIKFLITAYRVCRLSLLPPFLTSSHTTLYPLPTMPLAAYPASCQSSFTSLLKHHSFERVLTALSAQNTPSPQCCSHSTKYFCCITTVTIELHIVYVMICSIATSLIKLWALEVGNWNGFYSLGQLKILTWSRS